MLLFKPEHKPLILDDRKTQTRRLGKRRWRVGSMHQCYTRPAWLKVDPGTPFARIEILAVRQEQLGDITDVDVRREGYRTREEYLEAFARINDRRDVGTNPLVWVVDFRRIPER